MDSNQQFELLDIITILSFAMQIQTNQHVAKQATNSDILTNLHADLEVVDAKLDKILELLESVS